VAGEGERERGSEGMSVCMSELVSGNGWGLQGLLRGKRLGGLPQAAPPPSAPLAPPDPTPAPLVRLGGASCVLRGNCEGER
jgi:hypothetical protein